jgi:hypothetical protein
MRADPARRSRDHGRRRLSLALAALVLLVFAGAPSAWAQNAAADTAAAAAPAPAPPPKLTADQLDQLTAPIALYPDALLAQVLMASSYPLDVVAADRFMQKNANLSGDQMEQALQGQPWDISVKTLTHFPSVLKYMDDNLDWTQALGNAFVNQQSDVMASVQHMRAQAYAAGNLRSGPQQTVTNTDNQIVIAPAGETIYVPQYNPQVIYTQAPTTVITQPSTTVVTEPGYSTGDLVATGLLSFTAGVVVGSLINSNDDWFNWGHGGFYAPVYRGPGYGWSGWGRPPAGWNNNGWNRNNHYGNNNININNFNGNNGFRPWQPNNNRRPVGGQAGNQLPAAGRDFGYGANGRPNLNANNKPNLNANKPPLAAGGANRGQGAGGNALAGGGRGSTALQNSARGQQSLKAANRSGNIPAYKPPANRPAAKPPAARQNFNRGGGNSAFSGNRNGGFARSASQRGGNSMRSAQRSGFRQR